MFKKKIIFILLLIMFKTHSFPVNANIDINKNFETKVTTQYNLQQGGIVESITNVKIKNLTSEVYSSNFIYSLEGVEPIEITARENDTKLMVDEVKTENIISYKIYFNDSVVGKGKVRDFSINYKADSFLKRIGDAWELKIPKVNDIFKYNDFQIMLHIPSSFGSKSYMSPNPDSFEKSDSSKIYYFKKNTINNEGISAGFGNVQIFSFKINYHLENKNSSTDEIEIAIPPDTSTQTVIYTKINPKPINVVADADGNWIATYKLKPKIRLDVDIAGYFKVFALPRNYIQPSVDTLNNSLKDNKYWQANSKEITKLAKELKSPENIYNYVVKTLSYNQDKATPNSKRLGALLALEKSSDAICTEFTDLFIALSRAAGIPAREINGFAYTENPDVKPISLVADVLHAWPEYWDIEQNVWTPVDPTWGSTSGINYFDSLDLRHIAFVIHGEYPDKPHPPGSHKLGENPQKDVHVSFAQNDDEYFENIKIDINIKESFLYNMGVYTSVENIGNIALYNLSPKIYFDDELVKSDFIDVLPPFSTYKNNFNIALNNKASKNITFTVSDKSKSIDADIKLFTTKYITILFVVLLTLFFTAINLYKYYRKKKLNKYEVF